MYHFIVNPSSKTGKGIKIWQAIEKCLINSNIDYSYHFTNPKISIDKIVKKIFKTSEHNKKIVILGGDGTLNEIVNSLTDEELESTYIGYIPTGSSNDFARSLDISNNPILALKKILSSENYLALDIGNLKMPDNKEVRFVVSSGSGFDANTAKLANMSKIKTRLNFFGLGKFAYILKAISSLFRSPFSNGTITIDDNDVRTYDKMFFVVSMIQSYEGGGVKFSPDADPTDGQLSICIAHGLSKFKIVIALIHILSGKQRDLKGIELFNCRTMQVNLDNTWDLHTDGEYPGSYNSFSVTCLPGKLKLLV